MGRSYQQLWCKRAGKHKKPDVYLGCESRLEMAEKEKRSVSRRKEGS